MYALKHVIGDRGKERFRIWVKCWGESFVPQVHSVADDEVLESAISDWFDPRLSNFFPAARRRRFV